jgi:hypothetical protein
LPAANLCTSGDGLVSHVLSSNVLSFCIHGQPLRNPLKMGTSCTPPGTFD